MVTVTAHPTDTHPARRQPEPSGNTTRRSRWPARGRKVVGGFYLSMAGVHLGIVVANPDFYETFPDQSSLQWVRTAWAEVFMADPVLWGLVMFAAETVIGVMLLAGGRWTLPGWALVIGFHLALLLFGWGYLFWVVPVLAVVVPLAVADWRHQT